MFTENLKRTTNRYPRRYVPHGFRNSLTWMLSASLVTLLVGCGFETGENTILVRVKGTPGIPYEVKLDAGNDTDVQRGNGEDEFTFTTDDCLVSVSVNSDESDLLYVGLWINDEYDDRDTSNSGYVSVSGSCL
jgi:hypothetical protein